MDATPKNTEALTVPTITVADDSNNNSDTLNASHDASPLSPSTGAKRSFSPDDQDSERSSLRESKRSRTEENVVSFTTMEAIIMCALDEAYNDDIDNLRMGIDMDGFVNWIENVMDTHLDIVVRDLRPDLFPDEDLSSSENGADAYKGYANGLDSESIIELAAGTLVEKGYLVVGEYEGDFTMTKTGKEAWEEWINQGKAQ